MRRPQLASAVLVGTGTAAILYTLLFLFGAGLLNDPDTRWHITTGQWILAHAAVPRTDVYSHTLTGGPWVSHEWLAEVLFARAFQAARWTGVVALTSTAAALTFGLLAGALTRFVAPAAALVAAAASLLLYAPHLVARPHALAMPCVVVWTAGLAWARARQAAPPLWLLAVMLAWANLHAGAIVGVVVAAGLGIETVWSAPRATRRAAALRWAAFVAGAAAASLATPHGFRSWELAAWFMRSDFALGFVTEWQPLDWTRVQPLELWVAAAIGLALAQRVKVPPVRILLVASLVGLAILRQRNADLVAFIAPLLLAEAFGRATGAAARPIGRAAWAAALAAILVAAGITVFTRPAATGDGDSVIAPVSALQAVRQAGVSGPVFNDFDFGGFLIAEHVPVFVDSRVDFYGDDFMRAYAEALDGDRATLLRLFSGYGVTWTILQPSTRAVGLLDELPGWRRLYADKFAVVHAIAP